MLVYINCTSKEKMNNKYKLNCQEYLKKLLENDHSVITENNSEISKFACDEANRQEKGSMTLNFDNNTPLSDKIKLLSITSDVLLFLPGDLKTISELLSFINAKLLGELDKPIIIYNPFGYYDELIDAIDQTYYESFEHEKVLNIYHVSYDINNTLEYLDSLKEKVKVK